MVRRTKEKKHGLKKVRMVLAIALVSIILVGVMWYSVSTAPAGKGDKEIEIIIPLGTGTIDIAKILKDNKIIKSELGFIAYVKLNSISNFQAGTYYFKQSMTLKNITDMLKTGKMHDTNQIDITYLEGKNINWLAELIEEKTTNSEEDVYDLLEDEAYIDSLIEQYWFLDDVIKDKDIYYPLEGYLFPDTYRVANEDTTVQEIFKKMLTQTEKVLSEYREEIEDSKYSVHEILSIASMVETEARSSEDRKGISSVIYNRLRENMSLQIDITTYYAFKIELGEKFLSMAELNTYNPYNTRGPNMAGKLPIGPISSCSKSSIEAAIYPYETDYLFYASDKNFEIYFSKTNSEHDRIIQELKDKGLWDEY